MHRKGAHLALWPRAGGTAEHIGRCLWLASLHVAQLALRQLEILRLPHQPLPLPLLLLRLRVRGGCLLQVAAGRGGQRRCRHRGGAAAGIRRLLLKLFLLRLRAIDDRGCQSGAAEPPLLPQGSRLLLAAAQAAAARPQPLLQGSVA